MSTPATTLDLRKAKVDTIKMKKGIPTQKARVVLLLDYSQSMEDEYEAGLCQQIVERLLPIGLSFDDNESVEFYLFHTGSIRLPENITRQNVVGYIDNKVLGRYRFGGTHYGPVLREVLDSVRGTTPPPAAPVSGGFLNRIFGKKPQPTPEPAPQAPTLPTYVIMLTDGDSAGHREIIEIIRESCNFPIFIKFVGFGNSRFDLLEGLDDMKGRTVDNVDFFRIDNIHALPDEVLYTHLMDEFPEWISQARQLGILKS